MSRLEKVIELVKTTRTSGKQWIYNDKGEIRADVITGDCLELLNDLKEYEINASDNFVDTFKAGADCFYTYNYNTCIDKDIAIWYKIGCPVMVVNVHLYGDARIVFDTDFVIKIDDYYDNNPLTAVFELESAMQYKDINETLTADINIFSECYEVYNNETGETVGEFYEIEVNDLLKELAENDKV